MAHQGPTPISMCSCPDSGSDVQTKLENDLKQLVILAIVSLVLSLTKMGYHQVSILLKEGPPFEVGGNSADVHRWIATAPKWESNGRNIGAYLEKPERKKVKNPDHFYQITYQNIEKVSLRYRKENGIKSIQLEDTLAAMCKDGWRVCLQMIKQGIPIPFYDQFTAACKGETIFTSNRFAMMRRPVDYQAM